MTEHSMHYHDRTANQSITEISKKWLEIGWLRAYVCVEGGRVGSTDETEKIYDRNIHNTAHSINTNKEVRAGMECLYCGQYLAPQFKKNQSYKNYQPIKTV